MRCSSSCHQNNRDIIDVLSHSSSRLLHGNGVVYSIEKSCKTTGTDMTLEASKWGQRDEDIHFIADNICSASLSCRLIPNRNRSIHTYTLIIKYYRIGVQSKSEPFETFFKLDSGTFLASSFITSNCTSIYLGTLPCTVKSNVIRSV